MTAIACIGALSKDVVAGAPPRPGGAVYYGARALAHLHAGARIGAACSSDDRASLLPPVEAFGLPVRWHDSGTTTEFSYRYDGERRIMRQEAVAEPWSSEQALDAVGDAEWIHVGALTRSDFPPAVLRALDADGRKLLVDAQGLVRTPALGPLQTDGDIGDALEHVSILKLDEDEALQLGGASLDALRALGAPEVILTLGSRGSIVVTPDQVHRVHARAFAEADPTGAGDTYAAAYLFARSSGLDPGEAAELATETVAALLAR